MSNSTPKDERAGTMTRRSFVNSMAFAAAGVTIVPRRVLGGPGFTPPSDIVNVASIGAGGMGASNMTALTSQNIVAIADVDFDHVANAWAPSRNGTVSPGRLALKEAYGKAKRYSDFRRMLEEQTDIEAVVISTPDHLHAYAANMAMDLGKHVYVQKPLTWAVREGRVLLDTARRTGVVTQMGNQGHSGDDGRRVIELIRGGAIGPVNEVHVWTNRPIWPQGVSRPEPAPKPANLDWEMFLGPSPSIPYYPGIHPFNWRGWVEFGVGALGDMGAHLIDFPFWALEPGLPVRIETRHSPWGGSRQRGADGEMQQDKATYPLATVTHYEFNKNGTPIKMTWYDGGLMPPTPHDLPAGVRLNPGGGVLFVGEKGKLLHGEYGEDPVIFPAALNEAAERIPQSIFRVEGSRGAHEMNWIRAIRGLEEISAPFEYSVPLNETMILGIVALHAGAPIEYDGANMRITNLPEANQYLDRQNRRPGWEL